MDNIYKIAQSMIYISTEKINHCANLEYTNLEFHVAVIIYDNNLLFIPN